jgi:hypothetical protein
MRHPSKRASPVSLAAALAAGAILLARPAAAAAQGPEPERAEALARIVLLGDPHYPYKTTMTKDAATGERLVAAKESIVAEINDWRDVTRIVAMGDLVGTRGTEEEYRLAAGYLREFRAPLVPITGNHEYLYSDKARPGGGLLPDKAATRKRKLERFESAFGLESLQREERLAGYELVYLCADARVRGYTAGLSKAALAWLAETLRRNRDAPTIVFFHAPLAGTLLVAGKPAGGRFAAQPSGAIGEILSRNPQVFLWVSGHTHTPPASPNFDSPLNLYEGRIVDIHCTDLDRLHIYTNSLWLYPDRVVVRTYDHGAHEWMPELDRVVLHD